MSPAWRMSTYQPQPPIEGEPSRSQPYEAGLVSHRTRTTTPVAAARMSLPLGAPRSTPSWSGRSVVRKPSQIGATTGASQSTAAELAVLAAVGSVGGVLAVAVARL